MGDLIKGKVSDLVNSQESSKKDFIIDINKIRDSLQNIFFEIKKYKEYDLANQAQKGTISLMDSVSRIQKEIISRDLNIDNGFEIESDGESSKEIINKKK